MLMHNINGAAKSGDSEMGHITAGYFQTFRASSNKLRVGPSENSIQTFSGIRSEICNR